MTAQVVLIGFKISRYILCQSEMKHVISLHATKKKLFE